MMMAASLSDTPAQRGVDVIVVGSGAAGLATAVTARLKGLSVVVLEKADRIGGTSAISGGAIWIPDAEEEKALGLHDGPECVYDYIAANRGDRDDLARWEAFVRNGPDMLRLFREKTAFDYRRHPASPDYDPTLPGGTEGGRRIDPLPFDGRELGRHLNDLRAPLPAFSVFGGMMVSIPDINAMLSAHRSPRSFWHAAKVLLRYGRDRLRWSRGTRLMLGNALVARLLKSLINLGGTYRLNVAVLDLVMEDGRVTGVRFVQYGAHHVLTARRGVVLATGGFASGGPLAQRYFGNRNPYVSVAPDTNTGDGVGLGEAAGGDIQGANGNAGFWAPVSVDERSDGRRRVMPHFVWDRQKPGIIAVNRAGRRFTNEAKSYHLFVQAMMRDENTPAFLICDARALRRWGLGLVHPGPEPRLPFLRSGYLRKGRSLAELAQKIGVPADALEHTVADYNCMCEAGRDTEFGKGADAYQRHLGDLTSKGHPNLGQIRGDPFYAIELRPGVIGTATGLRTDARSQVLTSSGAPVPGLYAAGNDMASIMGGTYPGPGITLGPAMVFGYIAATSLAEQETEQ